MRINKILTSFALALTLITNAQQNDSIQKAPAAKETKTIETTTPSTKKAAPKKTYTKKAKTESVQKLDEGTIDDQFGYLINKSNRYQEYKVVKQTWLNRLRKATNDSLNVIKEELSSNKLVLVQKENKIESLSEKLDASNEEITTLKNEKASISLFGSLISKSLYSQIVWSIIVVLILALGFYIFKFNNSNIITKETLTKFDELEKEYENHRHRSLEREQEVRRKLQDEINKGKA